MNKLFYDYDNGEYSIHTKFISNKTIKKESRGAKKVSIYKCNELDLEKIANGFMAGQYITTLALN